MNSVVKALRQDALKYPETSEGVACAGTPIERRTIKVRIKAFLSYRLLAPKTLVVTLGPKAR